jgi:hypothetical protein
MHVNAGKPAHFEPAAVLTLDTLQEKIRDGAPPRAAALRMPRRRQQGLLRQRAARRDAGDARLRGHRLLTIPPSW